MEPLVRSVSKKYGQALLMKQNGENAIISVPPFFPVFKMKEMKKWILEAKFENVMENIGINLSQNIKNELQKLGQKLAKSTEKQELRGLETKELISIGYIVPKEIVNILKIIEKEKGKMEDKMIMEKLEQRILAKWALALWGYYYEILPVKLKSKFHLNINENGEAWVGKDQFTLNLDKQSGIFDVQIRMAYKVAEKLANKFGVNSVAFVLGDALASPHFFTGTGVSSGKNIYY